MEGCTKACGSPERGEICSPRGEPYISEKNKDLIKSGWILMVGESHANCLGSATASCVTLGCLLYLSEPLFPHL